MTTNCLKCRNLYEEPQDEAYYCPPCLEAHKKFTAEYDRKHPPQPSPEYNKLTPEERLKNWNGSKSYGKIVHY